MGENGLIKQAEKASQMHANSVASEGETIDALLQQLGTGSGQEENEGQGIIITSNVETRDGVKYIDLNFQISGLPTTFDEYAVQIYLGGNFFKFIDYNVVPEYSNEQLEEIFIEKYKDNTDWVNGGKITEKAKNEIIEQISSLFVKTVNMEITLPFEQSFRMFMWFDISEITDEESQLNAMGGLFQQALHDMYYCVFCDILGMEKYYTAEELEQQLVDVYKKYIDTSFNGTFEDVIAKYDITKDDIEAMAEQDGVTYELMLKSLLLEMCSQLISINVTVSNGDNFTPSLMETYSYEVTQDGEYTFTAELQDGSGRRGNTTVNITVSVIGVNLDKTSEKIYTNGTIQLTAIIEPNDATNKNVTWSSSNLSVATVDSNGLVTAVAPGNTTITVTTEDGVKTASCSLTVIDDILLEYKQNSMLTKTENTELTIGEDIVWIPAGFKVHEDSADVVDEGIVITDGTNEFVWVPVDDASFNAMFGASNTELALCGSTGVTTNYYSNLRVRSGDSSYYATTTPGTTSVTVNSSSVSGVKEPDLVVGSGVTGFFDASTSSTYYSQAGFTSTVAMAQAFVDDYTNMRASIAEYDGFYIGRYELTGTVENPTVKAGAVLTADSSQAGNWYGLYKACREVKKNDEYVTSTMIWGCQWDETMNWLKNTKFKGNESAVDSDSSSWGNYYDSTGNAAVMKENGTTKAYGSKQNTGYSEYWSANKIYDLAGNYYDWTQEAGDTSIRFLRGGGCGFSASLNPASSRNNNTPNYSGSIYSARATLYINL